MKCALCRGVRTFLVLRAISYLVAVHYDADLITKSEGEIIGKADNRVIMAGGGITDEVTLGEKNGSF